MKRSIIFVFLSALFSATLAGIYGALHDWITYNVSPEYYTQFKFIQFQANNAVLWFGETRAAMLVGIGATWWVGAIFGLAIGTYILGLPAKNLRFKYLTTSWLILGSCTITAAMMGYFISFVIPVSSTAEFLPNKILDPTAFLHVAYIHNFGYLGAGLGSIVAFLYLRKEKKHASN